jgi:peptide deformylase
MILPIVAYGDKILKKMAEEIESDYPGLKELIGNMFETMYNAKGVGLAAPQVGHSIRLFMVDTSAFEEDGDDYKGIKKVFINPIIVEETGKEWPFNEGCLSIPGVREDVSRQPNIVIEYYDENFELKEEAFDGVTARVIQHEYDHVEGILFTDKLNPLKRNLLRGRLSNIAKGNVKVDYKMKFPL